MKKLISCILSATILLSATLFVSAQENAEMLLPTDALSGTITNGDSSDMYYVDFTSMLNVDYDVYVDVDNAYDVFVELSDEDGTVLYSENNMNGEDVIVLNANNLEPGRYYVEVYGGVFDNNTLNYTISCQTIASNPNVFSGTNLAFNTFGTTYSGESYWKFTLDTEADVDFQFNAPTNKDLAVVIYNENDVYDYDYSTENLSMTTHLNAGTYYVKLKVASIGEGSAQIYISK